MKQKKANNENILDIKTSDQYRTVADLFERSKPTSVYYTLLTLSAFIIAGGLLLNNAAIVIGGMLVTPVLTPILLIGLELSVGELRALRHSGILVLKSISLVIVIAFFMAFLFGAPKGESAFIFDNSLKGGVLYFIVAIVSGVAATFAWVRKEVAEILPGIAIAVSLVPPLGLLGIGLSTLNFELSQFSLLVFLFNFAGVVLGSMVVFSLLKFHKTERAIERKTKENEAETTVKK